MECQKRTAIPQRDKGVVISEHDYDRMISVRASNLDEKDEKIKELEREIQAQTNHADRLAAKMKELEAELANARAEHSLCIESIQAFQFESARLRECLKRLEWSVGFGIRKKCMVCYGIAPDTRLPDEDPDHFGHSADCWLAAELKEGK
jgi:chromosome condensin MukBEF ATPase and DNA-binding subunit MukB